MEIRKQIHDILNALAIAKGLTEVVHSSLTGELEFTDEQKAEKLSRAVSALDRVDVLVHDMRTHLINLDAEKK